MCYVCLQAYESSGKFDEVNVSTVCCSAWGPINLNLTAPEARPIIQLLVHMGSALHVGVLSKVSRARHRVCSRSAALHMCDRQEHCARTGGGERHVSVQDGGAAGALERTANGCVL